MQTVELTQNKVTRVDDTDSELLGRYRWNAKLVNGHYYTHTMMKDDDGKTRSVYLHRLLLGAGKGVVVKHLDGDGLNNQRANLEVVKSIPGVQFLPYCRNKYRAMVRLNGQSVYLGVFPTAEDAIAARNEALTVEAA